MGYEVFFWICLGVVLKGLLVGPDFNIWNWVKYKKMYTDWYFNRESLVQYLNRTKNS